LFLWVVTINRVVALSITGRNIVGVAAIVIKNIYIVIAGRRHDWGGLGFRLPHCSPDNIVTRPHEGARQLGIQNTE